MDKFRVLYLIEMAESAFNRYDCLYGFEEGILYSENGLPESYEVEPLKQDIKDIMDQLQIDCNNYLTKKDYQAARNCIPVLEKLDMLLTELEKQD